MIKLFNFLLSFLAIISVALLLYGLWVISKTKRKAYVKEPYLVRHLYDSFMEVKFIGFYTDFLYRCFYLMYVNKVKAKVLAVLNVSLLPVLYIVVFSVLNSFSTTWYLTILSLVLSIAVPFYIVKNTIVKGVLDSRLSIVKAMTSVTSLMTGGSVISSFTDLKSSTTGSTRLIISEFCRLYSSDKDEAYKFLKEVTGDTSIYAISDGLKMYDFEGKDTIQLINKSCKIGITSLSLKLISYKKLQTAKGTSIFMFGIVFMFKYIGAMLLSGTSANGGVAIINFIALMLSILAIMLSFIFGSQI